MSQWIWMLGAAANVDVKGVVLLAAHVRRSSWSLGGVDWEASTAPVAGVAEALQRPRCARVVPLLVLLAAGAAGGAGDGAARRSPTALQSLQTTGLNARDAALQHRGYYEQLDVRGQLDAPVRRRRPQARRDLARRSTQLGILHERAAI